MILPIAKVSRPSSLSNQVNGNIDPSLMVSLHPRGSLHINAARAFKALQAACASKGLPLTFTYGGMYRTYAEQVDLFNRRYVPFVQYSGGSETPRKWWNNKWYWRKAGVASAAVPGTSNHGWGLAIDTAFDTDPTDGLGPDDAAGITRHPLWNWFVSIVPTYGFSWEDQSEPWHIRFVVGDTMPQAVLNFESGVIAAMPPFIPELAQWSLWPIAVGKPAVKLGEVGDAVRYLQGVLKFKAAQTAVKVDGKFGLETEEAVKNVQRLFSLTVDGWVGKQTWAKIDWLALR